VPLVICPTRIILTSDHMCNADPNQSVAVHPLGPDGKRRRTDMRLLVVGILAGLATTFTAGCGSASTSNSSAPVSANLSWLNKTAEPLNHKLNSDQGAINSALKGAQKDSGTYVGQLLSAYGYMLADVANGDEIIARLDEREAADPLNKRRFPSDQAVSKWDNMLTATGNYAEACSALFSSAVQTATQIADCKAKFHTMNSAIGVWSTVADNIQRGR
jgi:hypothetical protein